MDEQFIFTDRVFLSKCGVFTAWLSPYGRNRPFVYVVVFSLSNMCIISPSVFIHRLSELEFFKRVTMDFKHVITVFDCTETVLNFQNIMQNNMSNIKCFDSFCFD